MTTDGTKTAYSRTEAKAYDQKRFTTPAGRRLHEVELDLVFWMLKRMPQNQSVLEVGCGTGRILIEVLRSGHRVHGIDASTDMIEMLWQRLQSEQDAKLAERLEVSACEAAVLPFPNDTFDAVYAVRLLNQTETPQYALRVVDEMVRVTRPGGYTLVEFVNYYRPRWGGARTRSTRLRPVEVVSRGEAAGAKPVGVRGAFLLSMQAYAYCPTPLLGALGFADRMLSRCLPRLCSRTYVLFRKSSIELENTQSREKA